MTKKARRAQQKVEQQVSPAPVPVFAPRVGQASSSGDYGRRPLDSSRSDLVPEDHRCAAADDPFLHPTQSDEIAAALAIVNAALAREDATIRIYVDTPEGEEAVNVAFRLAGLSAQESRAWELHCFGFPIGDIPKYMDRAGGGVDDEPLSVKTVETYIRRGRAKLRKWAKP